MSFAIVVALDAELGIGKNGGLPWNLPGDMKHFKDVTVREYVPGAKNVVIMGRKTWDSIPPRFRPLSGRINVVISSQKTLKIPENVYLASSLQSALDMVKALSVPVGKTFVIGGGTIFRDALSRPDCQELYLTHVQGTFGCDTFFPELPPYFKKVSESSRHNDAGVQYFFRDYHAQLSSQ